MKTVYVLGGASNARWLHPFYEEITAVEYGHQLPTANTPLCDLLLFTGGQDLRPVMYNKNYPFITGSTIRDEWESAWYFWAVKNKVPMFGICRGMQLFTAMTGGTLIPDVDGHYGSHAVTTIGAELNQFQVNSIHHQMCVPNKGAKLLAWAENIAFKGKGRVEPEALWFPHVRALGVQWHPEMMPTNSAATEFVYSQIKEHIIGG